MRGHSVDYNYLSRSRLVLVLLLGLVGPRGALGDHVVANCEELKRAIERQQKHAHRLGSDDLRLKLQGDAIYSCNASIHISSSQSIVITGGGTDDLSRLSFLPRRKRRSHLGKSPLNPPSISENAAAREVGEPSSLFNNEGRLRLENVVLELLHRCQEGDFTEAVEGDTSGGGSLIWNSGELFVDRSFLSARGSSSSPSCCGTHTRGRLVHSEGAESIVVLQRSRLTVSGLSRCGDSAVAVLGGHLISRDSIFKGEVDTPEVIVLAGTESERNHATATPLLLPAKRTESKLLQHSHFGRASLVENSEFVVESPRGGRLNAPPDSLGTARGSKPENTSVRAAILATSAGTDCKSKTPRVCDLLKKMFEVVSIGNNNHRTNGDARDVVSDSGASKFGPATQNTGFLVPGRGLSASSGVVINQGLLLVILTAGLMVLVVLVCLGDTWIRRHPHHPLASFFTLPRVPSPVIYMPWRKESLNAFVVDPTQAPSILFSNYAVTDGEVCYIVPPDVQEALGQSAAGRTQSHYTGEHKEEGSSPGSWNDEDAGITYKDLEAALRGRVRAGRTLQRSFEGIADFEDEGEAKTAEFQGVNQVLDGLERTGFDTKSPQMHALSDILGDDYAHNNKDTRTRRSEGVPVDGPSFESAATEFQFTRGDFECAGNVRSGSGDYVTAVDHANAATSFEGADEAPAVVYLHGPETTGGNEETQSTVARFGTEHAVHREIDGHLDVSGTNVVNAMASSAETEFDGDVHCWRPAENDVYMTQAVDGVVSRGIGAPATDSVVESASGGPAEKVDILAPIERGGKTAVRKGDMGREGVVNNVNLELVAGDDVKRIAARDPIFEPDVSRVEDLRLYSDGSQVLATERVPSEVFRRLELSRSLSSVAVEISPVASLWKIRPFRVHDGECNGTVVTADDIHSGRNDGVPEKNAESGVSGRSHSHSNIFVDDGMDSRGLGGRREENELDPDDVNRTSECVKSIPLVIERPVGVGSDGRINGLGSETAISTPADESRVDDEDNLSYSPPSSEGDDDDYVLAVLKRTRLFFFGGTAGSEQPKLRDDYRGTADSVGRASQESEDSPFAFLSLRSDGTKGPYSFDFANAEGTDGVDRGGTLEVSDCVVNSVDIAQWGEYASAATQATTDQGGSLGDRTAKSSFDGPNTENGRQVMISSKRNRLEKVQDPGPEIALGSLNPTLERANHLNEVHHTHTSRMRHGSPGGPVEHVISNGGLADMRISEASPSGAVFEDLPLTPEDLGARNQTFFSPTPSPKCKWPLPLRNSPPPPLPVTRGEPAADYQHQFFSPLGTGTRPMSERIDRSPSRDLKQTGGEGLGESVQIDRQKSRRP